MKTGKLILSLLAFLGVLACEPATPEPDPYTDVFELTPATAEIPADGGIVRLKVSGTRDFHVSSKPDWADEPSVKGREITLSVGSNDSGAERRGVLAVCDDQGTCLSCLLTQKAPAVAPEVNWEAPFTHRSVFFRFTATWCGWCPRMANSVAMAQEKNPGKLNLVTVHGYQSTLEFDQVGKLMDLYKIEGYPSGVVDGRRSVENYDNATTANKIAQYIQETEDNYPVSSAIAFNSEIKGQKLEMDLFLYFRDAASYKLTVFLLEDGIVGHQENYEGKASDTYEHNHVLRTALTNVLGDTMVIPEERTQEHKKYSVTVPKDYKTDHLKIMVIVQRAFGEQKKLSDGYGDYYVDNCAVAKAGEACPLD